jgi:putative SOS response-associated peptidase YedK
MAMVRTRRQSPVLLCRDLAALDERSGTKKAPNIGDHMLFSIMTTEPNGVVHSDHEKAMPVMLMTPEAVSQWLCGGSVEDAQAMQKPAPDDAFVMRPREKKAA